MAEDKRGVVKLCPRDEWRETLNSKPMETEHKQMKKEFNRISYK